MEYFVYFEIPNRTDATKDRLSIGKAFKEYAQLKRERGECVHSPRCSSRFAQIALIPIFNSSRNLHIRRTEPCGP